MSDRESHHRPEDGRRLRARLARSPSLRLGAITLVIALSTLPGACSVLPGACAEAQPGPDAGPDAGPPPPRDLEGCRRALASGSYSQAEAGFRQLLRGRGSSQAQAQTQEQARLGLAQVLLETGRYGEVEAALGASLRGGSSRSAAETLLGEAELARGRLDEAERALTAAVADRGAYRARALLGHALRRRGRDARAQSVLMELIGAYNDGRIASTDGEGLSYVGMAAALLGSAHDANDAFQQSTRAAPHRVETQLEWAELFLDHYDAGHAEECVRQALSDNPHSPRAHALMARVRLAQSFDFDAAREELDAALGTNPSLVLAHTTRAGIAIREMDLAAAGRELDRALAIDPNDLEALSVRAALRFLEGDSRAFAQATQEVLRRHPRYSRMYSIIAEYADWEHRYAEIVTLARDAARLDPSDPRAQATLGINLLRLGQEQEGLTALRAAWRRDRFNVRVFNLLNLYEDVIAPNYVSFPSGPFVFRVHRDERAVMERYLSSTLGDAYRRMRTRYGFTPRGPIHIELYNNRQHFSVRTTGLPQAGVEGVCFGQVITALSPHADQFNWGQVTWHELAHVFHLQMSQNRVPRWFTEGLAEVETLRARPEWRREQDHVLYRALAAGRVPALSQMNHAFTHARSGEDMLVAYYASTQIVAYLEDRFTIGHLARMLREWGRGRTTEEVFRRVLRVSVEDIDRDFRAHTLQRLAPRAQEYAIDPGAYRDLEAARERAQAHPSDADAQAALAVSLLTQGQLQEAVAAATEAHRRSADQPLANWVLAQAALARGEAPVARRHLARLLSGGRDGYDLRLLEARVELRGEDVRAAQRALERATAIDPDRHEAWQGLSEIAEREQLAPLRLRALRRLVALDQHDRDSLAALMDLLAAQNAWGELVGLGEMSVFLDPFRAESRRLLGEAYLRAGRHREALAEADTALAAQIEAPGPVHLLRARALLGLRQTREARAAADEAVRADAGLRPEAEALFRSP